MQRYQGDLTDILRAASGGVSGGDTVEAEKGFPMDFSANPVQDFGDLFVSSRDSLLHDVIAPVSGFLQSPSFFSGLSTPPEVFSHALHVSPTAEKIPLMAARMDHGLFSASCSDSNAGGGAISGLQISSSKGKKRKCQARRVVCIPAPAPANSGLSGEIVPSDLWAWRKYGQKPIKGSPFPRGYYKCSSSKGCPARKQVERSRTDPNMLVITYTAEHNHPWPTLRNALAGSTRSQPYKSSAKKDRERVVAQASSSAAPKTELGHTRLTTGNPEINGAFPGSYGNHSNDSFFADFREMDNQSMDAVFAGGFYGHVDACGLFDFSSPTATSAEETKKKIIINAEFHAE